MTVAGELVATLGQDDVVGERGPILGVARSATVTATSHLATYAISRDRLLRLIEASPKARAGIEDAMVKRYGSG